MAQFSGGRSKNFEKIDELIIVSVQFVTRDLLDSGDWRVFMNSQPLDPAKYFSLQELRKKGFVGLTVIGSGIIMKLMDAYYGLYPWNGFYEPDYLDRLLVSPDRKPQTLLLK